MKNSKIIPDFPNNKWRTQIQTGIPLEVGDQIQIEATMIQQKGSPEETIEIYSENVWIQNCYISGLHCGIYLKEGEVMAADNVSYQKIAKGKYKFTIRKNGSRTRRTINCKNKAQADQIRNKILYDLLNDRFDLSSMQTISFENIVKIFTRDSD